MYKLKAGLTFSLLFIFNTLMSFAQEGIKTEILEEVNTLRKSGCMCGDEYMPPVPVLKWNPKLEKAALRHAWDMYAHDHFEHTGTDGSTLTDRIEATGYRWHLIGENLAMGNLSAGDAVAGWQISPGHCRTMMDPAFDEMGAAKKGRYWVLDLGEAAD
jgi:uncharacterized protein YkwD